MSTRTHEGLLVLMQLADSAFPAGGFAHSYGLEQLVRDGRIETATDVERFVSSVVTGSVATSDAVAAYRAATAALATDLNAINELDCALLAMKSARELREASTSVGRRMLSEVGAHIDSNVVRWMIEAASGGRTPATHAIVFGLCGVELGAYPKAIAAALMQSSASGMLAASMRLLPVSHRDVQAALHRLRPCIAGIIDGFARDSELRSFHPLQEIAAMRHRNEHMRLFSS